MSTALQHHPLSTGFGDFLRGARERRGLTLRQVSNETKIPWRHLDAIEHGDLTVVPNRIYRRAEVRAYAQAVGLDQNVALAELEQAMSASGLDADSTPRTSGTDEATHRRPMATLVTVGVGAILLLAMQLWLRTPAEPQSADPNVVAPSIPDAAALPTDVKPPATSGAPTGSAVDPDTVQSVAPAPVVTPSAAATAATVPVEDATAPATTANTDTAATPASTAVAGSDALVVTTDPAGARVVVDGIGWGTTPLRIRFLSPGDKTVRVIKDGYASEERTVHIADGRSASLHVPLRSGAN